MFFNFNNQEDKKSIRDGVFTIVNNIEYFLRSNIFFVDTSPFLAKSWNKNFMVIRYSGVWDGFYLTQYNYILVHMRSAFFFLYISYE